VKVKQSETVNRLFSEHLFKSELSRMYDEMRLPHKGAVKITVNVSNFTSHHHKMLSLLDYDEDVREKELSVKIHEFREKFGLDILKTERHSNPCSQCLWLWNDGNLHAAAQSLQCL